MTRPIVVIGSGKETELAARVCEFSILKHCPEARVIQTFGKPFHRGEGEFQEHRSRWRDPCEWLPTGYPHGTQFSFARLMVPEIVRVDLGVAAEAIYVDADMIALASVREVWELPMGDASVLSVRGGQWAVLKVHPRAWRPVEELVQMNYRDVIRGRHLPEGSIVDSIPPEWNHLDHADETTKLLHYTRMRTQPWAVPGHPFGHVFYEHLAEAIGAGFLSMSLVRSLVKEQDVMATPQARVWPQPFVLEELEAIL